MCPDDIATFAKSEQQNNTKSQDFKPGFERTPNGCSAFGGTARSCQSGRISLKTFPQKTNEHRLQGLSRTAAAKDEKIRLLEKEQACLNQAVENMRLEVRVDYAALDL